MEARQVADEFIEAFHLGNEEKIKGMLPTLTEEQRNNIFFGVSGNEYCELMNLGVQPTHHAICYTFSHRPYDATFWFSAGIDLGFNDGYNTPLVCAAHNMHTDLVRGLLSIGVDVNLTTDSTALCGVAYAGNHSSEEETVSIVKTLLEHGADPNITDRNDMLPLFWTNNLAVARLLREKTIDINHRSRNGGNVFHGTGIRKRPAELVRFFIEEGADVNAIDNFGYTPLLLACHNYESFEALLNEGAIVTDSVMRSLRYSGDVVGNEESVRIMHLLRRHDLVEM